MIPVTWRDDLVPEHCQSLWKTKSKPNLGQTQYLCVKESYRLNPINCIELVFNYSIISVQDIDKKILEYKNSDFQFLFLIVNKYLVFSATDLQWSDYSDLNLLMHWQSVLGWEPVYMNYMDNDRGVVGNWNFPITQLLLRQHG